MIAGVVLICCAVVVAVPPHMKQARLSTALSGFVCTNCRQIEVQEQSESDGAWRRRFRVGWCRECDWDSAAW
jgi:hypothetical protein